jgi:hypothetical protein
MLVRRGGRALHSGPGIAQWAKWPGKILKTAFPAANYTPREPLSGGTLVNSLLFGKNIGQDLCQVRLKLRE